MIRPLHLREEMHPLAVRVCSMFNGLETDSPVCFICGKANNSEEGDDIRQCAFCLLHFHRCCMDGDVESRLQVRAGELLAGAVDAFGIPAAKIMGEVAPRIFPHNWYITNVMCQCCERL